MREVNAGEGAGAEIIRAMGYNEIPRLAKSIARVGLDLGEERYRIHMFAGTIPNRWPHSAPVVVVAAVAVVVGHPD